MNKSDEVTFNNKLNQAKSDKEKVAIYLDRLHALGYKQIDLKSKLIDQALDLKGISIPESYLFIQSKVSILNRAGLVKEGKECCLSFLDRITDKRKYANEYMQVCTHLILFYAQLGQVKEAEMLGDKVIQFIQELDKTELYAVSNELYRLTGSVASSLGHVEKAITYLKTALKVVEEHHENSENEVIIIGSLADVYNDSQDYKKALQYYRRGETMSKELNQAYMLPAFQRMLGEVSITLEQYDKAEVHLKEALVSVSQINDAQILAQILLNLAKLKLRTNELVEYQNFTNQIQGTPYFKDSENFRAEYYALQSQYLLKIGDTNQALHYADKYEKITLDLVDLIRNKKVYKLKIQVYKALNEFPKLAEYYEKLYDTSNKIMNESNKTLLEEFEAKFQNEKKEKELQRLKLETVSSQLQSLRAQLNPHFVFNTIGSISQDLKQDNILESKGLLKSFARLMKNNLEFAERERITVKEEITFLHDYLNLEKNRLGDRLKYTIDCPNKITVKEIPSMVIQPYIENAIKHGISPLEKGGEITISFNAIENNLICTITDNGVGRKQAEQNKSTAYNLGKSTSINAKRLALLNENEQENILVTYQDLIHKNQSSAGTKVILTINS